MREGSPATSGGVAIFRAVRRNMARTCDKWPRAGYNEGAPTVPASQVRAVRFELKAGAATPALSVFGGVALLPLPLRPTRFPSLAKTVKNLGDLQKKAADRCVLREGVWKYIYHSGTFTFQKVRYRPRADYRRCPKQGSRAAWCRPWQRLSPKGGVRTRREPNNGWLCIKSRLKCINRIEGISIVKMNRAVRRARRALLARISRSVARCTRKGAVHKPKSRPQRANLDKTLWHFARKRFSKVCKTVYRHLNRCSL